MPDLIISISKLAAVPTGILGTAYVIVAAGPDVALRYILLIGIFYAAIEVIHYFMRN